MHLIVNWIIQNWSGLLVGAGVAAIIVAPLTYIFTKLQNDAIVARVIEILRELQEVEKRVLLSRNVSLYIRLRSVFGRVIDHDDHHLALPPIRRLGGNELNVRVFYATNRNVTGNKEPNSYYGSERGSLHYGVVHVSIPEKHDMGNIERPSIWRFEFREYPCLGSAGSLNVLAVGLARR
jgi:hypothetical protein